MPNEALMAEIMDGLDRLAEKMNEENKPRTNADRRIRAVSDEELAAVLDKGGFCPRPFAGSQFCVQHTRCKNCCLDWLQQPAKEDEQ